MLQFNCQAPLFTEDLTTKRAILESATNTVSNNMTANPRKQSRIASVEEPVLKEPATPAPVVEQPFSVFHENRPEESRGPTVSISDQLRPGKLFALFELQRELDIRSTGAVWLAEDLVR